MVGGWFSRTLIGFLASLAEEVESGLGVGLIILSTLVPCDQINVARLALR